VEVELAVGVRLYDMPAPGREFRNANSFGLRAAATRPPSPERLLGSIYAYDTPTTSSVSIHVRVRINPVHSEV
jgi:hypothetical protein